MLFLVTKLQMLQLVLSSSTYLVNIKKKCDFDDQKHKKGAQAPF